FRVPNQDPVRRIDWGESREYYDELQERKRLRREHVTAYEDFRYMLGTSAPVERLFSTAKYMLKDRRKRMGPIVFGALFLKTKREFWNSKRLIKPSSARTLRGQIVVTVLRGHLSNLHILAVLSYCAIGYLYCGSMPNSTL
ncbi:hypothetical protein JG688_00003836, partial [Phytophthora aleatoria]